MKIRNIIILVLALTVANSVRATIGPGHVNGKITNITSVTTGILVRIDSSIVPENCTSGQAWMQIKQENTAMITMIMTAWTLGRNVTIYTSPTTSSYCNVIQVDPAES
ncbi:hypothetical protein [Aliikangiella maris]|uniref:Uncharacterized protein n=2 Tax=Aliikangiella maris TaxID=3162458 RepID=A0ABV3MSV3_9GAMM